ncbi:MAG: 5-oxoprolinase subunit PxpB [Candidatus Aerophobetes bacterium]|nr:5-oxoprolinase subunit PxpB [Candidatus Aerophobetes bacterium]
MLEEEIRNLIAGERAVFIELANKISPEVNRKVHIMASVIEKKKIEGITEIVPTYRSLSIYYDPLKIELEDLLEKLGEIKNSSEEIKIPSPRVIKIPTVYGGEYGPDLEFVAKHNSLSQEEVIKIHTGRDYLVYMFGFSPGHTYLEVDERIATPRLKTPRVNIAAGSVGIGGKQTCIRPQEIPGGLRIIGRTPLKLFNPDKEPPVPFLPGDYLKFNPISEEEYLKLKNR